MQYLWRDRCNPPIAVNVSTVDAAVIELRTDIVVLAVGPYVHRFREPFGSDLPQWRSGGKHRASSQQRRHVPMEEQQQQGPTVDAVGVGVEGQNHPLITPAIQHEAVAKPCADRVSHTHQRRARFDPDL